MTTLTSHSKEATHLSSPTIARRPMNPTLDALTSRTSPTTNRPLNTMRLITNTIKVSNPAAPTSINSSKSAPPPAIQDSLSTRKMNSNTWRIHRSSAALRLKCKLAALLEPQIACAQTSKYLRESSRSSSQLVRLLIRKKW